MLRYVKTLVSIAVVLAICVKSINYCLRHKSYIFKESDVTKIGKKHVKYEGRVEDMVEVMRRDFRAIYHDDILPKEDVEMFFFGMGGYRGGMFVFHVSFSEYLIVFGTPIESSGYFVPQWANKTEILLKGESSFWKDGTTTATTTGAGGVLYHEWGTSGVVTYGPDFWMLSYGRGSVPANLPYYFATILFHSHDYVTLLRVMAFYVKCLFRNCLLHCPLLTPFM